jgi:hypothetical protein
MPHLLIRDLSPEVHAGLKRLADLHHRSVQQELHVILAQAVAGAPSDNRLHEPLQLYFAKGALKNPKTRWNREEVYGEEGR